MRTAAGGPCRLGVAVLAMAAALLLVARSAADDGDAAPPAPEISDARIDAAREELLAAFEPPVFHETDPELAAAERAREQRELARLRPVEASFQVLLPDGKHPREVTLRATHPRLDMFTKTVTADADGHATLRLPPGTWCVDVAGDTTDGRALFGRISVEVPSGSDGLRDFDIALIHETTLRFRDTGNAPTKPERVDLATEDLVHRHTWRLDVSQLTVLRPSPDPFVVQVQRAPTQRPGYLLRAHAGGDDVELSAREEGATHYVFAGSPERVLTPAIDTLDALSSPFEFEARRNLALVISGIPEMVVRYGVSAGDETYRFYDTPIPVDGVERTFTGKPPFDVSVGAHWNSPGRYNGDRYKVSVRVFLRDENGLIMVGSGKRAPFPVKWRALLGDTVHAEGEMKGGWSARLPKLEKKDDFLALRFDLELADTGRPRRLEGLEPEYHAKVAEVGRVEVQSFPQLAPNARAWARWADDLAASFRDASHVHPSRLTYAMWVHAMPGLSGWGGWNGNKAWGYFSDNRLFGFARPGEKNDGTVSHEMTHGHRIYAHGTYFNQTQNRAVRRMLSLRHDAHRVPAGQKFVEWIDALPVTLDAPVATGSDAIPTGSRTAEDPAVAEDELIAWYLRQVHGSDVCVQWRYNHEFIRWWLTLRGFSDDEARAGILTHYAHENLAWLIRRRGGSVSDRRADAALELVTHPGTARPVQKVREAAVKRWTDADLSAEADLDGALRKMESELGDWTLRARVHLQAADLTASRGDRDGAKRRLLDALRCAANMGRATFDATLADAARVLARER